MKKFAIMALVAMFVVFSISVIYAVSTTGSTLVTLVTTFIFGSIGTWLCIEMFSKPVKDENEPETTKPSIEYKVVKILDKYTIVGLDSSINYPMFDNKEDAFNYKVNLEKETRENKE